MNAAIEMGEAIYFWLADASLLAGVVVIVLLLVELLGRHWLTPRWRYAVWMVLMIRLALPVVPELPRGGPGWRLDHVTVARLFPSREASPAGAAAGAGVGTRHSTIAPLPCVALDPGARPDARVVRDWMPRSTPSSESTAASLRALLAWAAIAVGLALFAAGLARARRFEILIARARPVADPTVRALFESARRRMRIEREVELLESEAVASPALVGIRRPRVLLPAIRSDALSGRSLELVLCHELAHLRGRDIEVGLFLLALRSCFWFHPLVWIASARLATAREAWRDWQALAAQPSAAPEAYARTLLALAESRRAESPQTTLLPVHWNRTHELKRRIQMIHAFHVPTRRATAFGLTLLGALTWMTMTVAEDSSGPASLSQDGLVRVERASEPPAWRAAFDRALAKRFDLSLEKRTLREVIAELRRLSGVNIAVEPNYLESYGNEPLDLELRQVSVEEALDVVCLQLGEGRHGPGLQALVLGYDAGPPELELRIYQVQSLIEGAEEGVDLAEELVSIVQSATATVEGGLWDEEGAWMECWNGLLFVNLSTRAHSRVQAVLEFLASGGSRPATPGEPWREPLIAALARPAEIAVERAPLKDVLAKLSSEHGAPIHCNPDWVEEEITLELHGVDLATVLAWIGQQTPLRPRLSSGAILLDAGSGELELALYELTPVFDAVPDQDREEIRVFLYDLLHQQVEPGSWDADPLLEIRFWRSRMLVRHTPSAQRSIAAVLAALERSLSEAPVRTGRADGVTPPPAERGIRVALRWNESSGLTLRMVDNKEAGDDADLQQLLESARAERQRAGEAWVTATLDASPQVPFADVIRVVELCTKAGIAGVDFSQPIPEPIGR